MIDLNKEREAFLEFLRTKGVIKVGWNSLDVLTNLVREAGCTLSYNDIELMQEVWMEKAKAQAVPVWISTNFMLPDEDEAVLFTDKNNVIHDGYLSTDYVDGPYGENGEDFGDNQTLWASNSNGDEFLPSEIKYWMHRPSNPITGGSGAEQ